MKNQRTKKIGKYYKIAKNSGGNDIKICTKELSSVSILDNRKATNTDYDFVCLCVYFQLKICKDIKYLYPDLSLIKWFYINGKGEHHPYSLIGMYIEEINLFKHKEGDSCLDEEDYEIEL